MIFEFLSLKYFTFLWKFSETKLIVTTLFEIVKHNHLKSSSYNYSFFIFYFLQKQRFFTTLIEYDFYICHFIILLYLFISGITLGISIIYGGIHFEKFCNIASLFTFAIISTG